MSEDNTYYRDDDCQQANGGQQIVGKNNDAKGFNDQSDNLNIAALAAENGTTTGTTGTPGPAGTSSTTIINYNTTLVTVFPDIDLCSLDVINNSNGSGNTNTGSLTFTVTATGDNNLRIGFPGLIPATYIVLNPTNAACPSPSVSGVVTVGTTTLNICVTQ